MGCFLDRIHQWTGAAAMTKPDERPTPETDAKDWPGCPMCARLQRYAVTAWNRGHTMGMKANEDIARQAMDALRAEKSAHADTNAQLTADNMRLERERDVAREALTKIRDLTHTSAEVLRGIADYALQNNLVLEGKA